MNFGFHGGSQPRFSCLTGWQALQQKQKKLLVSAAIACPPQAGVYKLWLST